MRVLHVIEAIEAGVARHVTDLVCRVDAEHEVLVPAERVGGFTDVGALEAMEAAGARVRITPMRRSVAATDNARAIVTARRLIAASRPDAVHGHASIGGAVARLAAAGTPSAVFYTPHGLLPGTAVIAAERVLGRLTDRFVAVSPSEAELLAGRRIGRPGSVATIPNGIELQPRGPASRNLRAELGAAADAPLVGCICRLAPQKAPEVFVRACGLLRRSLPEARFVLIGDGPLRDLVEREIRAGGLGSSLLLVPGMADAAAAIAGLDAFVLASRYEGGPYAPLEAMRERTPVVLSDVVGNRDTVIDGETGLLVPVDDPAALAAAIGRVLAAPELAARLVEAAAERLAARFDVRQMAARTAKLYESAAGARAAG